MFLHGSRADAQNDADLGVRLAAADPQQNVGFTVRQSKFFESGNSVRFVHKGISHRGKPQPRPTRHNYIDPCAELERLLLFAGTILDGGVMRGNTLFGV